MKKILFLTGTRADYGKLKSLIIELDKEVDFEVNIFITGMHMLSKYGSTWKEIEKDGFLNSYHYINQNQNTPMDIALSNTITGLSHYVSENRPDLIVVHGDRLEALAGAIVGAFNNILVAHIEGGEVSGTIDESIRHAITKFSHIHLVSNEDSMKRIIQMGENEKNIYVVGSPDIDIMLSEKLPSLAEVKKHYEIPFENYSIVLYHPVTTEIDQLQKNVEILTRALLQSDKNYVIIFPNNDLGNEIIINQYNKNLLSNKFKIFPSIRFEYFLTLMKHADFMIGNSSAGIRETTFYNVPSIDIGNRQKGRYTAVESNSIQHVIEDEQKILEAINHTTNLIPEFNHKFGDGESAKKLVDLLKSGVFWDIPIQKKFNDLS